MVHIRKINTLYGQKYAVVDLFTHYPTKMNRFGKPETSKTVGYFTVDYVAVENKKKVTVPAIFDLTAEGLAEAKEVQKLLKNK